MTSYAATAMTPKSEDERDRPPDAGAASGRQDRQPRALSRRGGRGSRSAGFYAPLSQAPPISRRGSSGDSSQGAAAARITAQGKFSGSARETTLRGASLPGRDTEPAQRSAVDAGSLAEEFDALGAELTESDSELGALLAAIADEVQDSATAARGAIMADFGARIAYVRKHLRGHQRAAALGALKEGRKAALAIVKRNAAQELAGRKKAAIAARRRPGAASGRRRNHAPNRR
jgi:hypothetical protein